jgi:uroporphyrinogen decarboxylase
MEGGGLSGLKQEPRRAVLDALERRDNECGIIPYTVGFEAPELEARVSEYFGEPWQNRLIRFIDHPFWVNTVESVNLTFPYSRDMFGSVWRMDKLPWHLEEPVLASPSFRGYAFPKAEKFVQNNEKTGAKKNAAEMMAANGDVFHVISMGWGLFEHSWRMRGFENALCDMVEEESFYGELVERIADIYVGLVDYCADVKADAILFGDDWGAQNGLIMGAEKWRRYFKSAWKRVYDRVHLQGKYVLAHSCGSVYDIIPDAIEIGLDMLESVQPEAANMDTFKLKREFGDKIGFWGTLGSQSAIPFFTPERLREHMLELKREAGRGGGYIMAPAKPIQPETPLKNAVTLIETLREMNDI